ncbi:hypothetical protein [Nitratifractor sp.]
MKTIVETLAKRGIVCKRLEPLSPKELGSRKRVEIYRGVERDDYYCMVMVVRKKSRILRKETEEFEELHRRLEAKIEAKIKRRYLLLDAPICSKAAEALKERGWRIFPLEG